MLSGRALSSDSDRTKQSLELRGSSEISLSSCSVRTGYQKNRFQNVLKVFTVSDEN